MFQVESGLSRERTIDYLRKKLAELEKEDDRFFDGFAKDQRARLDELYSPEDDEADINE